MDAYTIKLLIVIATCLIVAGACKQKATSSASTAATNDTYQDITVEQAQEMIADKDVVILDVRTPKEIAEGAVSGHQALDYRSAGFDAGLSELDKEKTYVVYCRSGGRSASACEQMKQMGFESVYNVLGGYNAWSKKQ